MKTPSSSELKHLAIWLSKAVKRHNGERLDADLVMQIRQYLWNNLPGRLQEYVSDLKVLNGTRLQVSHFIKVAEPSPEADVLAEAFSGDVKEEIATWGFKDSHIEL